MSCAPSGRCTPQTFPFLYRYHGTIEGSPVLLPNDHGWVRPNDPVLNRLVATALAGNPTLVAARARVTNAAFDSTPGLINLTTMASSTGSEFMVCHRPNPAPPSPARLTFGP